MSEPTHLATMGIATMTGERVRLCTHHSYMVAFWATVKSVSPNPNPDCYLCEKNKVSQEIIP